MRKSNGWVFCLVTLLATSTAGADSLEERTAIRKADERLGEKISDVKKRCGDGFGARVDWKSFEGHFTSDYKIANAGAYCAEALSAVRSICEDSEDGKAAVQTKLKNGFVCRYDGSTAKQAKVSIDAKTAVVSYDWKTPNLSLETKKGLMQRL